MSAAIAQDLHTGEMIRQQAIHGNARMRDAAHVAHESRMQRVADDVEPYLAALLKWIALLDHQAVVTIVGWYAHEHGLSFIESLATLFRRGDAAWIRVCKEFGAAHV